MTVLDALKLGRRWWWILLLFPILAGGATYIISSAMTPIYNTEMTIVIEERQPSDIASYNDILAAERQTRTFSHLLTTRPILEETIRRLGLTLSPEALKQKVSVSPVRDTQLVVVSVTDPSAELAATITNTIGQVFVEQIRADQGATDGPDQEELQQHIADIEGSIDDISTEIADLESQPNAEDSSNQALLAGLRTQLGQYQTTYSMLLDTQEIVASEDGQASARVRIAEQAIPSTTIVSPRTVLNTTLASAVGLLIAVGLVMVVGYVDDTIKSAEDVQRLTGKAMLGAIPIFQARDNISSIHDQRSPATESFRGLRTNLQFATVGQETRSLVLTSARPGDGKTTMIANLGAVLAQGGQQVIIVDADLRKPRLHKYFDGVANYSGLTNLLVAGDTAELDSALQQTEIPGVRVLTSGPLPPSPPDLLNSPGMHALIARLEQEADIVLIDSPPMAVSDPLVVAGLADGVLLVILSGSTRSKEMTRVIENLERSGTPLLGVIVNQIDLAGDSYYYYQSYYGSDSDTSEPEDQPPPGMGGTKARERRASLFSRRTARADDPG